jgi:isopenicillin-N N-acyltransferase-like protein
MLPYAFKSLKPREIGREHGEHFRESVRAMASVRLDLMFKEPQFKSKEQVFDLAGSHLPILERYDADLYAELLGIAEGSALSPQEIVVLNHYTDMRDIGGCTTVFAASLQGNLLGQTWDIDSSALPHVQLLQFKDSLVFTVAGCLGLTGFNESGVGICINNLTSLDAKVGLVWPALVRRVLRAHSASEGRDLVMGAPLGSGHHYAVADKTDFFAVETSGTYRKELLTNKHLYWHTNHCLDPEIAAVSTVRKGSTTHIRYDKAKVNLMAHQPENLDELWRVFAEVSLEIKAGSVGTCGAMAMNLKTSEWKACQGPVIL